MKKFRLSWKSGLCWVWLLVMLGLLSINSPPRAEAATFQSPLTSLPDSPTATHRIFLPRVSRSGAAAASPCTATGQAYGRLPPVVPAAGDMSKHPDVNLAIRGYAATTAPLNLVDYTGQVDPSAPQLYTLFANRRTPTFSSAYQVYRWDWTCNCRSGLITKWPVTLLGMSTTAGETIHLPVAGYDIGGGYGALVLYAEPTRITLKYTRDDDVVEGYTIHLENICVDANLLALYRSLNAAGRGELPALKPGQALGRAPGSQVFAAIRDSGSFLDPRSRKDWWQGR